MKKCKPFILLLAAVLLLGACTTRLEIRFTDKNGNDIPVVFPSADVGAPAETLPAETQTQAIRSEDTAPPETAASPSPDPAETAPAPAGQDLPGSGTPATKEEILALYKAAVTRVRGGEAGYDRKTWEATAIGDVTGIPAVDHYVQKEVDKRATPESEAQTVTYEKGSSGAAEMFPDCTLTDAGQIASATCVQEGGVYRVKIVMNDETTPQSVENSMLGGITDIIIFRRELERELKEKLSAVKNYDYEIVYKAFEVDCEITADGRFISVRHHAVGEVHVASVQILFLTIRDKNATIYMDAEFTNFNYG